MNDFQFRIHITKKFEGFSAEVPVDLWPEIKGSLKSKAKAKHGEKAASNLITGSILSFNIKYAVKLLAEMEWGERYGKQLMLKELMDLCGINKMNTSIVMAQLHKKGWVGQLNRQYYLKIDIACSTLYDLVVAIDGGVQVELDLADQKPNSTQTDSGLIAEVVERLRKIYLTELFTYLRF